jgi:hypothetical protein
MDPVSAEAMRVEREMTESLILQNIYKGVSAVFPVRLSVVYDPKLLGYSVVALASVENGTFRVQAIITDEDIQRECINVAKWRSYLQGVVRQLVMDVRQVSRSGALFTTTTTTTTNAPVFQEGTSTGYATTTSGQFALGAVTPLQRRMLEVQREKAEEDAAIESIKRSAQEK